MNRTIGTKVGANAKAARERRRAESKLYFEQKYNAIKLWQPVKNPNMNKFVAIPKHIIGVLPKPALAVYPVLCSLADFERDVWFQESLENIGLRCGLTPKYVKLAINSLIEHDMVQRQRYFVDGRVMFNYRVVFVRKDLFEQSKGEYFVFFAHLVETGLWAKLPYRAKALYLALRAMAVYDHEYYCLLEDLAVNEAFDEDSRFIERLWDVCWQSLHAVCTTAHIGYKNISTCLQQLEQFGLVERMENCVHVYLRPLQDDTTPTSGHVVGHMLGLKPAKHRLKPAHSID